MHARQLRQGALIGVFVVASFGILSLIWGLVGKAEVAVTEARNAKAQYTALEERRRMLEANLAALKTPRGQDAAIRTAFGVARPGEEVIVVVPPASATPTATPPWWKRLFSWF